jgi:hypothetical protein
MLNNTFDELFRLNIEDLHLSDNYVFKLMIEGSISLEKANIIKSLPIKYICDVPLILEIENINYNKGFKDNSNFIAKKILNNFNLDETQSGILSNIIERSTQRINFKTEPHIGQFNQFIGLLNHYSGKNPELKPICFKIRDIYLKNNGSTNHFKTVYTQ